MRVSFPYLVTQEALQNKAVACPFRSTSKRGCSLRPACPPPPGPRPLHLESQEHLYKWALGEEELQQGQGLNLISPDSFLERQAPASDVAVSLPVSVPGT